MPTMENTRVITRSQLIYGLCLSLAVLLGYLLAEPYESSKMGVVVLLLSVLVTPLIMRWHHPLLVFSWNAVLAFSFLPGRPPVWLFLTAVGFVFVLLNRCVNPHARLLIGGSVPKALLWIALVVAVTALATGGAGIRVMGSDTFGGKRYIFLMASIMGYFVLTGNRVPPSRAMIYTGLFFLSGLSGILSSVANLGGGKFDVLYYFLTRDYVPVNDSTVAEYDSSGMFRVMGITQACGAVCLFMLARWGVRGIFDLAKPWRLGLTVLFFGAGLLGGSRSFVGFLGLIFAIVFFLEGLYRSRSMLTILLVGLIGGMCLLSFSTRLPKSVQRSLSFLPIEISPAAKLDAQVSMDWRLEMWKTLIPEIPRHLILGKGYVLQPGDLYMANMNAALGMGGTADVSAFAGDYHNGPLSVLLPFGIWGALAFGWFLIAAGRVLYLNCAYGDPELKTINQALFACFLGRTVFFFFLVGGLDTDLPYMIGLIGLGVSLNGETRDWARDPELEPVADLVALEEGEGA